MSPDRGYDAAAVIGVGMILYGLWRIDPVVFYVAGGVAVALTATVLAFVHSRTRGRR